MIIPMADYDRAHLINDVMTLSGTPKGKFTLAARNYENLSDAQLLVRKGEFVHMAADVAAWRETRRNGLVIS